MKTEGAERCPYCKRPMNEREVELSKDMIEALLAVVKWAKEKGVARFRRRDINHVLERFGTTTTANFGNIKLVAPDLVGGKHGEYVLNHEPIARFFAGELAVPIKVGVRAGEKGVEVIERGLIQAIRGLESFLDAEGDYIAMYTGEALTERNDADEAVFPSRTIRGKDYTVVERGDRIFCNCLGFKYRKTCRHVQLAAAEQGAQGALFPKDV